MKRKKTRLQWLWGDNAIFLFDWRFFRMWLMCRDGHLKPYLGRIANVLKIARPVRWWEAIRIARKI